MSDQGYVYLLINSTMEGLVKIGKTNRSPEERAIELSRATGVATPFIVVYKEFFNNCTQAESFIHSLLEQKNYRVSSNREFFNAPVDIAIKVIMEARKILTITDNVSESDEIVNLNDNQLTTDLADELIEQADDLYYGRGKILQDIDEAVSLYKKAYKLGSATACDRLGSAYIENQNYYDTKQAIKYLKEGIIRGNIQCYVFLAELYCQTGNIENAIKCWNQYHDEVRNNPIMLHDFQLADNSIRYLEQTKNFNLPLAELDYLKHKLPEIVNRYKEIIQRLKDRNIGSETAESDLNYAVYVLSGEFLTPRFSGKVKFYKADLGGGMLYNSKGKYYFSKNNIIDNNKLLREGQDVSFGVILGTDGMIAHTIVIE